jgi:hypothetical protein
MPKCPVPEEILCGNCVYKAEQLLREGQRLARVAETVRQAALAKRRGKARAKKEGRA